MRRVVVFLFLFTACSVSQSPLPPTDSQYDIVVEGASIKYHGKSLPIGGLEKEWLAVLGPPSKDITPGDHFYVWDDLGLYVRNHFKFKNNIVEFGIVFDETSPSEDYSFWPKHPFTGRLIIDGGLVSKDTPMDHIKKQAPKFREGPTSLTYNYRRSDTKPTIYVSARIHENRTPFYLAITDSTHYTTEQLKNPAK
jgi:hypothetical protein